MDRLITPEAVELDLARATVATRIPGRLLDALLQVGAVLLVSLAEAQVGLEDVAATVVLLLAVFIARIVYPVALETRYGCTLGQRAMGLRIVTDEGGPIRLRQAIVRAAVGLFEIELTGGLVALLVAGSRRDGKRLGDVAAGTVAVSVRVGTGRADVLDVTCPPQLVGWAATLDTSGLSPAHRATLRRFHERARTLEPVRRDALAAGLADRLLGVLATRRPVGAGPVEVLAAIQVAAAGGPGDGPRAGAPPVAPPDGRGVTPPPPPTGHGATAPRPPTGPSPGSGPEEGGPAGPPPPGRDGGGFVPPA